MYCALYLQQTPSLRALCVTHSWFIYHPRAEGICMGCKHLFYYNMIYIYLVPMTKFTSEICLQALSAVSLTYCSVGGSNGKCLTPFLTRLAGPLMWGENAYSKFKSSLTCCLPALCSWSVWWRGTDPSYHRLVVTYVSEHLFLASWLSSGNMQTAWPLTFCLL